MNRFSDIDISGKRLPPIYGYHSAPLVSIEKALEPLESEIPELSRYIQIAKKYCHYPSEHGLSQDQSTAIYIYTMEWGDTTLYRVLNNALRLENRQAVKVWFPYLKLFDTALDKLPTFKGNVWRGVALDIGQNFTKNQLVTWWSINSCSISADVIKSFLANRKDSTLFLIEAIDGKLVSGYTAYENENEVILRMGTQFRVKSNVLHLPDSSYIVPLEEIVENNETASAIPKPSCTNALEQLSISSKVNLNAKWKPNGITIAGGHREGNQLNQLQLPFGISVVDDDNEQCIFIADCYNHRIMKWKSNATHGQIVAGGNGEGNRMDQLNFPTDVIYDKQTDSLIIADQGNQRVMRWSLRNDKDRQVLISDVDCARLAMDKDRNIYASIWDKNEVRRWKMGDKNSVLVAGGRGKGASPNQLSKPVSIVVDEDYSVYVSDNGNHRVMKWMKDGKCGIDVAGGSKEGSSLSQLSHPQGLIVDQSGHVYVADSGNHRVVRWSIDSKEISVIAGGNDRGTSANQFNRMGGIAFDRQGNLIVVDNKNHRVQKFLLK